VRTQLTAALLLGAIQGTYELVVRGSVTRVHIGVNIGKQDSSSFLLLLCLLNSVASRASFRCFSRVASFANLLQCCSAPCASLG
jgi:hypothetical protein